MRKNLCSQNSQIFSGKHLCFGIRFLLKKKQSYSQKHSFLPVKVIKEACLLSCTFAAHICLLLLSIWYQFELSVWGVDVFLRDFYTNMQIYASKLVLSITSYKLSAHFTPTPVWTLQTDTAWVTLCVPLWLHLYRLNNSWAHCKWSAGLRLDSVRQFQLRYSIFDCLSNLCSYMAFVR